MPESKYEVTVQPIGAHKPMRAAEVESVIERAVYDAIDQLLDPENLEVNVEEV
jgi:hypothetical protein